MPKYDRPQRSRDKGHAKGSHRGQQRRSALLGGKEEEWKNGDSRRRVNVEVVELDRRADQARKNDAAALRSGRKTRNVVAQPGVSTMSTKPSWASATDLAMARPSPVPGTPISVDEASR